jgi:hypothetical protein
MSNNRMQMHSGGSLTGSFEGKTRERPDRVFRHFVTQLED